jgi:hypothetical protein
MAITKSKTGDKVIKQCICGATLFQGPFPVGELVMVDGIAVEMDIKQMLYLCRNCNRTLMVDEMIDRAVGIPA